jgi:hypothetical protein
MTTFEKDEQYALQRTDVSRESGLARLEEDEKYALQLIDVSRTYRQYRQIHVCEDYQPCLVTRR